MCPSGRVVVTLGAHIDTHGSKTRMAIVNLMLLKDTELDNPGVWQPLLSTKWIQY